jgi:hypothetical protein
MSDEGSGGDRTAEEKLLALGEEIDGLLRSAEWPVPGRFRGFSGELAHRLGEKIAGISMERCRLVQNILRDISLLSGQSEERFLFESVGALVLQIGDLPASEKFHHRERFGLLDHSLEVAGGILRRMSEGSSQSAEAPDRILWAQGALGMGLYHDLGKVFDVRVWDPGTGVEWNPAAEPLALFKRRAGIPFLAPTPLEYRKGRGEQHEERSLLLLAELVPVSTEEPLLNFLVTAMTAYVERHHSLPEGPLQYLIALTSAGDVESGAGNFWRRVRPEGLPRRRKRERKGETS